MTDKDKEIIFVDDYFKVQDFNEKHLKQEIISNLEIIKKIVNNDQEINNYGYDILFNLQNIKNFKVNENIISFDKIYNKIENIYKKKW